MNLQTIMEAEQLLLWDARMEDLAEANACYDYCHDQLHCIGLMSG